MHARISECTHMCTYTITTHTHTHTHTHTRTHTYGRVDLISKYIFLETESVQVNKV